MADQGVEQSVLATEVWRLLLDYFRGHVSHQRVHGELALNPGAAKLLIELQPDDPRPMRALADTFACDASNITWLVDQLEERGLVERRTLPSDRRVKTVALTDIGVKTQAELLERMYEAPEDLSELPLRDLEALRRALAKLPAA